MSTMNEGTNGLSEKILKELNQILENRRLTEFDIVPVESTTNKSPVLYVATSLGLESWCVKHVYNYCYSELIRDFLTEPKRRLSRLSNLNYKRIYHLLNATILINPDVTSLWNKRREMTSQRFHSWGSEMRFTKLVLTRKPKCNEAYSYRRWILTNLFVSVDDATSAEYLTDLVNEEIRVCNMAADKCMNNYHCWDHRAFVMDLCLRNRDRFHGTLVHIVEYKFIKDWTASHVSDYSCFHYRQVCIGKLFTIDDMWPVFEMDMKVNLRENFQKILAGHLTRDPVVTPSKIMSTTNDDDLIALVLGYSPGNCTCYATWNSTLIKLEVLFYELLSNDDLLKYYKNHQTIWYHRRFIVNKILETLYNYFGVQNKLNSFVQNKTKPALEIECKKPCEKCANADLTEHHNNVTKQKKNWLWNCPVYRVLIRHEKALLKDRWREEAKSTIAYDTYLKFFEGLFLHFNS